MKTRQAGISSRARRALTAAAVAGVAGLSVSTLAHAADEVVATAAEQPHHGEHGGPDGDRDGPRDGRGPRGRDREDRSTVSGIDVEARARQSNNIKLTTDQLNNPQTVTVVSKGIMEAQNLLSLRDVLMTVPGITFGAGEGGGGFGDSINLRGYSANNDITIDNVRDSAQYSRSDTFNLEQLEVTNGANSVYSGAGSVGGTINIVSKRPGPRDSTTVQGAVGSDNYYRATVDTNQRINETMAFRFNAMAHKNDYPGRDVEKYERYGFAPSFVIGLHSPTQFTAQYFYQTDKNTPTYGVPYYNGAPVPGVDPSNYYGYKNVDEQKQTVSMWTGILDHDFGEGLKVRNLSRYQVVKQSLIVDPPQGAYCLADGRQPVGFSQSTTGTNLTGYTTCTAGVTPGAYQPSGPRGTARFTRNTLLYNQTDLSWDGEIAGVRHTAVLGFAFLSEDFHLDNGNALRAANGATPVLPLMSIANPDTTYTGPRNYIQAGAQDGQRKNQAIYLFDNIQLNPLFAINFGLRYEHNEGVNTTDTYITAVGPTLGTITRGLPNRSNDNLLTYRVGLVYKPAPNASLYVAYGNSETPSQATVNGSGACTAATNCTVDPEKAENFEIGGKWDIHGLSLTGSLFRNDRSNYRVASNDITIPVQQLDGSARVDGFSLGASGRITDQWSVFANYTYLKSKVLQGVDDYNRARNLDFTAGDPLLQVPDHAFSVFTTYDLPDYHVQLGYGLTYQGEAYLTQHALVTGSTTGQRTTIPLVKSDDYMTHRITVAWTPVRQLELRLNINNLLNKEYYTNIRNNGWAMPGEARSARLTANYRF